MWKRRSFTLPRSMTERKKAQQIRELNHNRRSNWMRLLVATLPSIVFGVFTVVFTIQQNSASRATREQDRLYADAQSKRALFDNYIDIISTRLLTSQFNQSDYEHLQTIRVKTLSVLRHLDQDYKREIILFLYENNLIRSNLSHERRLNLDGADLSNGVQFRRSITNRCILDHLYLPGVFASNIIFDGCDLIGAVFDRSILTQSQFINCSLAKSSFNETSLHQSNFHNTDLDEANFTGAFLTETTFFDGVIQQVDFTNADLFGSNITDRELVLYTNTTKANVHMNTRFPNGSFSYIDSGQLVINGGLESSCSKNVSPPWFAYDVPPQWLLIKKENDSMLTHLPEPIEGICYFLAENNRRNYQHLKVKRFSTLIDVGEASCNFSVRMGCSQFHPTNNVYIDLRFINARNFSDSKQLLGMTSREQGFQLKSAVGPIPRFTRVISVRIGATLNETTVKNISQYCFVDDIKVFIFHRNKTRF